MLKFFNEVFLRIEYVLCIGNLSNWNFLDGNEFCFFVVIIEFCSNFDNYYFLCRKFFYIN